MTILEELSKSEQIQSLISAVRKPSKAAALFGVHRIHRTVCAGAFAIASGRPVILVEHGRISAENLRRTRVTLDELTGRLREQGILDPATVNYAILETNGQLSVFPYAKYRPASAMDAGIEARDESLPVTVIADGRILRDNLRLTGRDRTWLDGCLRAQKCRRKDVLLLTVDGSGVVHMQRKGTRK